MTKRQLLKKLDKKPGKYFMSGFCLLHKPYYLLSFCYNNTEEVNIKLSVILPALF